MNTKVETAQNSIIDDILLVTEFQYDLTPLMDAIEDTADENSGIAEAIARSIKSRMNSVELAINRVIIYCRNHENLRIERERAAQELAETDDFTAAAIDATELARRLVLDIGKLCEFAAPTVSSIHGRMTEMEKMGAEARALAARFGAMTETRARNVSGNATGATSDD